MSRARLSMTPAASDRSQVLLCTGSFASQPPGIPFDNQRILDADSVNGLSFLPKSVVVAGSGIIAIEMANIFRKLGSEVTMVVRSNAMQALDRIGLDKTIAETPSSPSRGPTAPRVASHV